MADLVGHAGHDPLRVAEAVDRDARLASVLDLCLRCTSLYVDLVALTAALPGSALPARPRSFTLTVEDARRLRPGGWRGWWSAVGSARDTLTRPLAIGITTLGLAGLLLSAAPALLVGVSGAASSSAASPETVSAAASDLPVDRSMTAAGDQPSATSEASTAESPEGPPPTLTLSVGLLAVGAGLFAIRRVAPRGRPVR